MSKRSVFLATVVAVAVIATLPVGGTGAIVSAPAAPTASTIVAAPTAYLSADAAKAHSALAHTASTAVAPQTSGSSADHTAAADNATSAGVQDLPGTQTSARAIQHTNQRTTSSLVKRLAAANSDKVISRSPHSTTTPSGCPANVTGATSSAPGATDPSGVKGTTSDDIASFALAYNAIRVAHCMKPIPLANIKYDSCLEQRMFWMADDPSTDWRSAWGHTGTAKRSDGLKIVGCDGDIAGGMDDTGAVDAQTWWDSPDHKISLYQPNYKGSMAEVCIGFAMAHGGVPNDPANFTRAAAAWQDC